MIGFDPGNGKVDFRFPWKARFKAAVSAATPVVVGNEVFISEAYGPGSCLLRVKPGGYDVVWQDELRSRNKALQLHWNTPVYHDGYLYGCSGRHAVEGEIRCVQWSTGKVMWRAPVLNRSSLLFIHGQFIALGEYGELLTFKANGERFEPTASLILTESGDENEKPASRLLKYPAWSAPVVAHGFLYLRGKDKFVCLDLLDE